MGIVEATVTNKGKKGLIRRFAPYFKKYLWILIFDLFCAALTTVCELALPIIVQQITDRGINDLASLTLSYCLLYTSPSPRDVEETRMPSSA